ncbi:MAG: DUF2855 family protein [Xanthobacteraceae bacterium]
MPRERPPSVFSGFCVAKNDLRRWLWDERDATAIGHLGPDHVEVGIDKFAFTANNVTYARLGDQIGYWRFFPAPEGWGYIPVWGLGHVTRSRHPEVPEGERVYGYFPMATHLIMQPSELRGARFLDAAEHRRELPKTYNEYVLTDRDLNYDRLHEDHHLVLRPLFSLSFFCAEYLKEERFFGAKQILISSASSKAALGLAFLLVQERSKDVEIIGLTSSANLNFVVRQQIYDDVVTYDSVSSLSKTPTVFVDLSGDAKTRAAVHHALGDSLRHSTSAGFTHWDTLGKPGTGLPGPVPKLFFTPDHIIQRREQWGAETLRARLSTAWQAFLGHVEPWLVIELTAGRCEVERIYCEVLDGRTPPERAHVLAIQ